MAKTRPAKRRADHQAAQELQKSKLAAKRPASRVSVWIYLALLLVTVGIYAQTAHFDFVNYDDPEYVKNPHTLQGLTPAGVKWALTSGEAANWFPLTRLSHMLDVQLFGIDAGMHHLTNTLFHALAAVLLFAFLNRATKSRWPSAFVALVFAVHPMHVESVAWVAERKDVLNAVFWFLTLWSYVRYVDRPVWQRYFLVLGAFCLGLMTKPMILTLPFVLMLIDFWPLRRLPAAKQQTTWIFWEKVPLLLISAIAAIATYLVQESSRAVKTLSVFPLALRVQNAPASYAIYLEKTIWPTGLAVFYPYPRTFAVWQPVLAGALVAIVSAMVLRLWRTRPYLAVGWFWFIGTSVPVIGLVQVGAQARADRYMYIPMVGLLIMLAWTVKDMVNRWPGTRTITIVLAIAVCLTYAAISVVQISYWRDSETLFAHALTVTQGNYVAEHNLGLAIADTPARLPEAIAHYRAALAIRPDSVETRSDLGSGLAQLGQFTDALVQYKEALQLAPDCEICRRNLQLAQRQMAETLLHKGVTLEHSGQTQAAIEQFEQALQAEPDNAEAHNDLGVAFGSLGQTDKAIEHFSAALRIKPDYADARYNLQLAQQQKSK